MDTAKLNKLIEQVKYNCDVSDAAYGGNLSLCNMLLRLRQLYFNEHSLKPWQSADNKTIINWIGEREDLWHTLDDKELNPLLIQDLTIDPFNTEKVNEMLKSSGIIYGAGYGMFGKPQFFLARQLRTEIRDGVKIYYLDKEFCTDLLPSLALSRDKTILVRKKMLVNYIFYKFRDRKSGSLLEYAFSVYNLNQRTPKNQYPGLFSAIADDLYELIVLHEMAEIEHRSPVITTLLSSGVQKNVELFFRAIKDCMADLSSNGPIEMAIREKREDLLTLYFAFLADWHDTFFPSLPLIFQKFQKSHDFAFLEKFRSTNFSVIKKYYLKMAKTYKTDGIETINQMIIGIQKKPQDLLVEV